MLRWPAEEARRRYLAGRPRLLVVDDGQPPPSSLDCLEDWVRTSTDAADVAARVQCLLTRCRTHRNGLRPPGPDLDPDGVLRAGPGWVALPALEARITRALLEKEGAVVSREVLMRAGWPQGAASRNALDVHMLRLRRRIAPLELAIRTVRSRGYLLEVAEEHRSVETDRRLEPAV